MLDVIASCLCIGVYVDKWIFYYSAFHLIGELKQKRNQQPGKLDKMRMVCAFVVGGSKEQNAIGLQIVGIVLYIHMSVHGTKKYDYIC